MTHRRALSHLVLSIVLFACGCGSSDDASPPGGGGGAGGSAGTGFLKPPEAGVPSGDSSAADAPPPCDPVPVAVLDARLDSCQLVIEPPADPNKLNLSISGALVPQSSVSGTAGGWRYDPAANPADSVIVLVGSTCTDAKTKDAAAFDLEYGCDTVE